MNRIAKDLMVRARQFRASQLEQMILTPGKASMIGAEKGRVKKNGISKLVSSHGSYRYVYAVNSVIVSGLQIMSRDGKSGIATNVYTEKEFRRKGYASKLLKAARKDFKDLDKSSDLSEDGKSWTKVNWK